MFTHASLFVILWLLLLLGVLPTALLAGSRVAVAAVALSGIALGVAATSVLRIAVRRYPDAEPVPIRQLALLLGLSALAEALVFLLPEEARLSASFTVLCALAWGAGGLRDQRVLWFLYVASPVLVLLPTGNLGAAVSGLVLGLFLVFTVQSSLWLVGVVDELDHVRATRASLAVAEERLRFSRDVHDVMGRRLATIAAQAGLAAALSQRGDQRTPERILEVRETAHAALGEARELARGYRPLDLAAEVAGAVSLLRSAGIAATADLADVPAPWHEPVARVVRESVTTCCATPARPRSPCRTPKGMS